MEKHFSASKKVLICMLSAFVLAAAVLGVFALMPHQTGEGSVDDNALIIGTIKLQEDLPIVLNVRFDGEDVGMDQTLTFQSDDSMSMFTRANQSEDLVFVDFSETMRGYSSNLGINYWRDLSEGNHVYAWTECLNGFIVSAEIEIDDCGIWLINVASETGAIPDIAHAYVYTESGSLGDQL